jgi:hypothetical protein
MRFAALTVLSACLATLVVASPATAAKPRLAPSDRAAVNATLDVFVNHAVKREDAGASYDVVTPNLRGGMSRKAWAHGTIPVYPYPAKGNEFHSWTIQYRNSEELAIELLLSPRASKADKLGQILFHVYLQPAHGRWLVDSFMPGATFAPAGKPAIVQAAADFTATPSGSNYNRSSKVTGRTGPRQISAVYAVVPFGVIGLLLLGLAGWGITAHIRNRHLRGPREGLPPGPARPSGNRSPLSIHADGSQPRPRHRS